LSARSEIDPSRRGPSDLFPSSLPPTPFKDGQETSRANVCVCVCVRAE
jgi:hypothetical protein